MMLFTTYAGAVLPAPPTGLHINYEPFEQLAAVAPLVLGWALPPSSQQHSFELRLQNAATGALLLQHACVPSPNLNCSASDGIPLDELAPSSLLRAATTYTVSVRLLPAAPAAPSAWSAPVRFATALADGAWPGGATPVWAANATQNFVLFRRSFQCQAGEHLLHITAHGVPMRKKGGGANATKLLGAYKLWVNGMPVATGPGRPTGEGSTIQLPAQLYDTVNVTDLLRPGEENVVAVQSFYWNNEQEHAEVPSTTVKIVGDEGDRGGVQVLLRAGADVVAATGDGKWLAYDEGDRLLLRGLAPPGCQYCQSSEFCIITGGRFQLMHERWNVSALPTGWMLPGFAPRASAWSAPHSRAGGAFPHLAPKRARAIALLPVVPARIRALTPSGVGDFRCTSEAPVNVCAAPSSFTQPPPPPLSHAGDSSNKNATTTYCYVVDMGEIIQGGLNITFASARAGQQVAVIASELLAGMNDGVGAPLTGAVQPNGTDQSVHYDVWELANGELGPQTVVSHEYVVARFWQVMGAPDPPSAAAVVGWKAWYPMHDPRKSAVAAGAELLSKSGVENSGGAADSHAGQTVVRTSDAALDAVWELCRNTGRIGAMDVNTDSNARQRDNCNVDSHITALHQAAAGPAASAAYRRRNALFLFEPDGKVHPWTEFKLFSLGAVHAYSLDTGDLSVANATFDNLLAHYSLTQFIDPTSGLVVKGPMAGLPPGVPTQAADNAEYYFQVYQDLVDYPNMADAFNDDVAFPEGARCCLDDYVYTNVSSVINAHVAQAHRKLADMSRWLARPAAEAARLDRLADGIVVGLRKHLLTDQCDPPAPACYADGLGPGNSHGARNIPRPGNGNHTAVQGALFVAGCGGLLPPAEALQLLPFLRAKTAAMPLFSAMASNFFLEGLYRMAAADATSSAADFAFEVLTRDGHRSWMEMIAANATMTTEHWYGTFGKGGTHTWSHPWSAAPARIIPQWLMGVRPLERAWRRIAVHPQPGAKLTRASMQVPTLRGEVAMSFARELAAGSAFMLNLTFPGNTLAEVCLPVALLAGTPSGGATKVLVNGAPVRTVVPNGRPGQLCIEGDLPGGTYNIVAQ